MLKRRIRQYFTPMGGVERSPRQGFQSLCCPSTIGRGYLEVTGEGKKAFTLAEVLITLGIIGVVAAMTIPTLVANYQERTYNTAATTFERKLGEALKVMNSQSSLAGFSSTEDFVEELSKHFKITKTCANDELTDCFENEVLWGSGETTPEVVDMTIVKTTKNFGLKDWQQTNVVGVQFASGVTALVAYNKDANQDPYSNEIITLSSSSNGEKASIDIGTDALAMLYDTNGFKSPNKSSKDLRSINVTKLGSGCYAKAGNLCIATEPFTPLPITKEECQQMIIDGYGIKSCSFDTDYWAGAVKQCGGISKMASMTQLAEIANIVYNTSEIGANQNVTDLTYSQINASQLGLPSAGFYIWSSDESSGTFAYRRVFSANYSSSLNTYRNVKNQLVICLDN